MEDLPFKETEERTGDIECYSAVEMALRTSSRTENRNQRNMIIDLLERSLYLHRTICILHSHDTLVRIWTNCVKLAHGIQLSAPIFLPIS